MARGPVLLPRSARGWNYQAARRARREIFAFFDSRCGRCGFTDIRALQIDHIASGGGKHIRRVGNYRAYYRIVLDNLDDFQLLCANCNWIKRYENRDFLMRG